MKYKVIKFGAVWCGPCRVLEQKLKDFKKCEITRYDIDNVDENLLVKFRIRGVPATIILDENDNEVCRWTGLFNVRELEDKLNELEKNG